MIDRSGAVSPRLPARPDMTESSLGDGLARAARIVGIAAIVATFVPFSLFAAPVLGAVAAALGAISLRRLRRAGRSSSDAVVGLVLGLTALAVSSTGLWLFRHAIGHALHDIAVGMIR
jgi:hypothetical protein